MSRRSKFIAAFLLAFLPGAAQAKPPSGTALDTGHALYTSLQAAWGFLEGSGTTTADSTGNGNTFTLDTGVTWTTIGGEAALDFDGGANADAGLATAIALTDAEDWSIAWRAKQAASTTDGIFLNGVPTNSFNFLFFDGGNLFRYRNNSNTSNDFNPPNTFTSDHNYLLTFENAASSGTLRLFVDGVESTNSPKTSVNGAFTVQRIGGINLTNLALDGSMTYLYVWKGRKLTGSDAAALHTDPYDFFDTATPATSYTFTGPTSGVVDVASTDFTVTPNGDADGITVTPATDGAGSFTPASVTFTGSDPETFTYTPTSATGSPHTLSVTDDGGLTDPASIDYAIVPGGITCTDQTAGRVYQRAASTTAKTITLAGAYTGTVPTTVEVKIVAQSGGATVQDWTVLSSPTISGGNWSGSLSVPQGGWYNFLARGKDGGGSVLFTSDQTTNKWGVGVIVLMLGQSNMEAMTTLVSTPPASSDLTRMYTTAGGWAVVTGNGTIRFANQLQSGASLPIAVINYAESGSTIGQWNADGGGIRTGAATALTNTGGDCEFVLWHIGESDSIAGTSKSSYKSGMDTFYAFWRTQTGRSTSTLKYGHAILGTISDGTATDSTTDAIRQGQLEWIAETTGAFFAGSSVDMVRFDGYHWTTPYYERMGRRYAQAILKQMGLIANGSEGPTVVAATRELGSPDVRVSVTHNGGSVLEELDGSTDGGSVTGFEVTDDDFATTLTISSTAFGSGQIVLTLSAAPGDLDTIKVRYQYGETPSITNPVYDNQTPQSDTIGLPLQPTIGSFTATVPADNAGFFLLIGSLDRERFQHDPRYPEVWSLAP